MRQTEPAARAGYLNENYRFFHLRDTAGAERDFHFHEFDKVVLLRAGKVSYIVENVTYSLSPGSVLLVPHHAIHKAVIDQSVEYDRIIIYIDRRFFRRNVMTESLLACFDRADRREQCLLIPTEQRRNELEKTIEDYEAAQEDAAVGADAIRDTIMLQLLIRINRISSESKSVDRAEQALPTAQEEYSVSGKLRQVLSYINENLGEDLSVDTLASLVYLSRYHFMHQFRAQTGTTVHVYVRQRRLLNAARLIRAGVPAGQAAVESGFADYSTFHRAFRQSFGISPGALKGQNNTE